MEFTFKVWDNIKEAWKLYKENFGNLILFFVVSFIAQMIINSLLLGNGRISSLFTFFVFYLVSAIFSFLIYYLLIKSILGAIDHKGFHPFSKETLSLNYFWNFIKTIILLILCIVPILFISISMLFILSFLGKTFSIIVMLLLFISYFFVMARLFPAVYLSIDKNQGARKNIIEAWSLTKDCTLTIIGKFILIFLFILLGFLALFVGLIITYPIALFVIAMMYRELVKFKSGSPLTSEAIIIPEA